ncbi:MULTISPECIES: neutral zinc metallopeptidase [Rhodococcus]|uniref:neutral zinc metallopeptidase n=1 Tax=Rhodococcus TaxID=1827 RepID=UPI00295545E8|nr:MULTISPECIES: neutral zinc metallopeptidase [Rhodococcus]MDV7246232.1 neutral zinc metallopeptidase [Rhodococcus oxybenzonivorans]MDV7337296.1 neutral zinc metallopeptidase [Rhodococcus oxybenzonivorans]MDV8030716.1 neutral zinc metallopeptidase [Rhodococcus sp. IEGM 27]
MCTRQTFASVVSVIAVLICACGSSDVGTPTAISASDELAPQVAGPQREQPSGTNTDDMLTDIDTAVSVVNQFWAQHWSELFTGKYTAPYVVGLYDGGTSNAATCAGEPFVANNAFYCPPPEDFVAWDRGLMAEGYAEGDAWVYLVVAHEWGHAIQHRLADDLVSIGKELQADCLAGAVLYGAASDGTLLFEEGDQKELAAGLVNLADETPWTDSKDHGDPFQRVDWFDLGRAGGVKACFPS